MLTRALQIQRECNTNRHVNFAYIPSKHQPNDPMIQILFRSRRSLTLRKTPEKCSNQEILQEKFLKYFFNHPSFDQLSECKNKKVIRKLKIDVRYHRN